MLLSKWARRAVRRAASLARRNASPRATLRAAGRLGATIAPGAAKSGANEWKGNLLNTENGKTYSGVLAMEGNGLSLKGCIGFICQGETWTRMKE